MVSAQYPMAFDEQYHFGLIQLHAHQWLPFFTSQPTDSGAYGAIARDPSYLYHWLMSLPYRLIALFTPNQTTQIICLRVINVALFAYALTLYRTLVRRIGASRALTNSLFAVFVLIPVVPFLAATINYDNLLMVAIPVSMLLGLRVMKDFREKRVSAPALLGLCTVLLLASLIKFPFLPVFAVMVLYSVWLAWHEGLLNRRGVRGFTASYTSLSVVRRIVLLAACLLAFGLFAERYMVNAAVYHVPVPACDAVIGHDTCMEYGPYGRDAQYKMNKPATFRPNFFVFAWEWLYGMWFRLYFAINQNYYTRKPLFVVSWIGVVGAVTLAVGILMRFRSLFRGNRTRQLIAWVTAGYIMTLFLDNFKGYAKTGMPVAINGRYLIPFLLFLFAFGGIAWSKILHRHTVVKTTTASIVIALLLLQGGGTMTYILRAAGDDWYWNNSVVRSVNRSIQKAALPVIIERHWN